MYPLGILKTQRARGKLINIPKINYDNNEPILLDFAQLIGN